MKAGFPKPRRKRSGKIVLRSVEPETLQTLHHFISGYQALLLQMSFIEIGDMLLEQLGDGFVELAAFIGKTNANRAAVMR